MPNTASILRTLACVSLVLGGGACSGAVEPLAAPPAAQLNVFPAYAPERPYPFIFVDRYDTTGTKPSPVMSYGPYAATSSTPGTRFVGGTIFYATMPAGDHRFMFADSTRTVRADTTVTMMAGSSSMVYLADSLLRPSIVVVPEEPLAPAEGATSARFINLSPDSRIDVKIVAADGSETAANIPQGLGYRTVTPYATLDSALALRGKFFLRLYHAGTQVGAVTLNAERGRAYIVVTYGYRANATATPSGSTQPVYFQPSLVTAVRVSH